MDRPILSQNVCDFNARAEAQDWRTVCDNALVFNRPELSAVAGLWFNLAGGRPMPERLEMTPRLLKPFLPHVAIYDCVPQANGRRRYRVRVMGSSYQTILGEHTGRFLDESLPPKHVEMWHAVLDAIVAEGAPLRFCGNSTTTGKTFLVHEYFSAPLADADGAPVHVLGVGYYGSGRWQDMLDAERGRFAAA
jgi:hypothetical protein